MTRPERSIRELSDEQLGDVAGFLGVVVGAGPDAYAVASRLLAQVQHERARREVPPAARIFGLGEGGEDQ